MKVLMASHYFASHKGGIEIVAEELYRGFAAERGDPPQLLWLAGDATAPPEPAGTSRALPLPVLNFVERRIGLPFPIPTPGALRSLRREVGNADVVILHDCLYLSNIAAFLFARLRGVPVLLIQHIGFVPYSSRLLLALLRAANTIVTRPMLSRASQVVFISETTRNYFGPLPYQRAPQTVFNGVDTSLYRTPEGGESQTALRRKYGLPEERPVILFVGRFVEKKGLTALRRMAALRPDWCWAFAGWGPLDPSAWNAPNVRVFSQLRGASLAALYRACDLLALPSTGEGFPLVVQEALASGLPVVCGAETLTADPAMREFVRGVPVYANDDERTAREFLSAIGEQLEAGTRSPELPQRRRRFAEARYSWRHACHRYLEIAARLVSERTPSPAAAEAERRELPL